MKGMPSQNDGGEKMVVDSPHGNGDVRNTDGPNTAPSSDVATTTATPNYSIFKSFRGRSVWDADDDEFDPARQYTIATLLKSPPTTNITTEAPVLDIKNNILFESFRGRRKGTRCSGRKYSTATSMASPTNLGTIEEDKMLNLPTDSMSDTMTLGANDTDRSATGLGLRFTSTSKFGSKLSKLSLAPADTLHVNKLIRKAEENMTVAGFSKFNANMWDPDDEEWLEVDANKVVDTFKTSYRPPKDHNLPKISAVSYLGASIQNTVRSVFSSPAKDEALRAEEITRDNIEELQNTYYCDPNGNLSDEIMEQVLITDTPSFPARHPDSPRSMHIVDLPAYFMSKDPLVQHARPRLCDAVATVLSHTTKECLEAFLNPSVKEFVYRREVDNHKGGLILVIRREGNEVVAGAYCNFGFVMQWKLYVKSVISITGEWHEVFATLKPGLMDIKNGVPEWGNIKEDPPVTVKYSPSQLDGQSAIKEPGKSELVSETNPKFALYQGGILGRHLLWDLWYGFDQMCGYRAIWEADGVATNLRMKRMWVESEVEDKIYA